ncbi:hypothetical protein [Streptomyces sp. TLI_146]|uniref:hypothetical protein n=1 Tax=Streptomyces sp. TLI_146 TaxID=1938858 RepID=UPI000CC28FE1|nr:hypothetical protein [Streptomyces sp. TLI_146]PKV82793.1 hypothetical protein BX283_0251 [Streptomyces sp. TLI_146]
MNDMVAALAALTDRDPNRRDVAADSLGDLLRGTALDADTARLAVGHLVSLAVNEPMTTVRESALNSISEAFNHHRLPLDLVEPLAAAMPTMTRELLEHALYILGATHDSQARLLIEHRPPTSRPCAAVHTDEGHARPSHGGTRNSQP